MTKGIPQGLTIDVIMSLHARGLSTRDIASVYDCEETTVRHLRHKFKKAGSPRAKYPASCMAGDRELPWPDVTVRTKAQRDALYARFGGARAYAIGNVRPKDSHPAAVVHAPGRFYDMTLGGVQPWACE